MNFLYSEKGKWQVSVNGGDSPLWSPDGRELFYRSGDSFIAVAVETEPSFELGKPGVLFRGTHLGAITGLVVTTIWNISPDGRRFLMLRYPQATGAEATAQAPSKINIVLNWLEEMKQRVPEK